MKQAAFTLAEGICALIISSLIIFNISLAITGIKKTNSLNLDPTIDWYLFLHELESDNHRFEIVQVQNQQLLLFSQAAHRNYELKGSNTLYLTCRQGGGYLPLLDGVKPREYSFTQLDSQRVLIEVTRTNGKKVKSVVKLYPPSSE
ncbi:ComGF family competence protein [Limosilactobacillus caviae]|uniref:ComGF family competence protein n=1 Tax=Limosilactobacillus caviae TaxID=1769424 RepID=UPI00129AA6F5|nr:ComGF family competence protein [Limosilactobacillus caviae]MBC8744413.1 ComGF family competence protein [Lactobacillus sp. Marseille-P7033]MCD7124539.1 ComGF family competence protein [Limosilactobacillus caviae]MRH46525.1 hypothetical protein [Limosilactobacillus reuteri]NGC77943.1 ComGF family competence protein [Limosilactobacillus reuteri]